MQATIDDLRARLDRSEDRVTAFLAAPPKENDGGHGNLAYLNAKVMYRNICYVQIVLDKVRFVRYIYVRPAKFVGHALK